MKSRDLLKDRNMLFFFGAAIGVLLFIITYGTAILDPFNDAWILRSPDIDIRQHYVGFLNFYNDSWTFPIGNTDSLSYPYQVSIVWTDSIPGVCVLLKLFRFMLPQTFQFFGIFGLVTFALNGAFAALLVYEVTKSRTAAILSCPFFIMSFTVIHRLYYHTALASHWIILAALLLFFGNRKYNIKRDAMIYALFSFLCVSIHSYFLPMAGGILLIDTIYINRGKKKSLPMLIPLISFCAAGLLSLFVYGAFSSGVEHGGFAIGEFNSNLNTLFNSLGYGILPELPLVRDTQYEGFGYLGLGVLILLCISLVYLAYREVRKGFEGTKQYFRDHMRTGLTILMGLCFAVAAVFPEAGINSIVIIPDVVPGIIKRMMGIFRSNGRFIWPLMYLIMLSCIYVIVRMTKKAAVAYVLICACLLLQSADLRSWVMEKREFYTAEYKYWCYLDRYGPDKDTYDHIVMTFDNGDLKMDTGYFASKYGKTINRFYFARVIDNKIEDQLEKYREALAAGDPEPGCIYFFDNESIDEWDTGYLTIEKLGDNLYLGY